MLESIEYASRPQPAGGALVCLGIPARVLAVGVDHPDIATVDMGGVARKINIGLLGDEPLRAGTWILVHMGYALQVMTEREARDALTALSAEREAEQSVLAERKSP